MVDLIVMLVGSVEVSPSGLWRPPAKRVGSLKLPRGFKSLHLRHETADAGSPIGRTGRAREALATSRRRGGASFGASVT